MLGLSPSEIWCWCVLCLADVSSAPSPGLVPWWMLLGDGARKEAAGVEQYVLVRGD
jgi:hypothetical protein